MTQLQEMRPQLVVISGSRKDGFKENDGDTLWSADGIPIQLHYHRIEDDRLKTEPRGDGRPVLLLHGASAGADTFLMPRHGKGGCFVDFLISENYEPWLLDWRASKEVAEAMSRDVGAEDFKKLNFNRAAEHDITAALDAISALRPGREIDVVAHCMGAATLAEALLRRTLEPHHRLSHVVLSTIGLFYQMNLHGRLKAEARLLERVQGEGSDRSRAQHFLDPRPGASLTDGLDPRPALAEPWPELIETLYRAWRLPYDETRLQRERVPQDERPVFELFNRLSFMFGEPYQEGNLAPEMHHRLQALTIEAVGGGEADSIPAGSMIEGGGEVAYDFDGLPDEKLLICRCAQAFTPGQALSADGHLIGNITAIEPEDQNEYGPFLPRLFGKMSLDLFQHGAENLRAGLATMLPRNDAEPSKKETGSSPEDLAAPKTIFEDLDDDEAYEGFKRLERVTLIGGGLNRLWHRDCIDRMADWLDSTADMRGRLHKEMLLDYGHQDLFWGRRSAEDVFPAIVAGLGSEPRPPDDGKSEAVSAA